ncbi:uncharacterized protein LOC130731386 isoform X2 [Lotus japonicus]|uniref:uncharacterized protein LOC130731386 isoform X2 n=1 Tax=Lotus japonicus TaxID=34305 RepID=UPI0025873C08|nr:uncharacterized protein LOC130731386 isoform X2 [Lotus japonicus]
MGEHESWPQPLPPSGLLPNGLLPDDAASVMRVLDMERWLKAEERIAELIASIQPNPPSEDRRHAVADYVQRLITKCFPCQVFTFGSVPLKTYLPDGDIDLTAFSESQNVKDAWAHQVRDMLEKEEKDENAEFHVKEVQFIQAEVKIIKCLVENIVVDISFNQLGGLCTLCFLEEVDNLINQNHLFKRSVILIKAWCYYESRILGAHHGLISTYALETLVLYIFHVFNNSFAGPLEVLYRFLEFFSKFDWDNFCVSLWGPVPISSLPDVTAEPPRKDSGDLLLSKLFLDACSTVYAVFPSSQENQGQPFVSKYFNVIDPLRVSNNLGRSVSKGNFFRIRSAFAFGAKKLARLLDCPKHELFLEVNQFFLNTWDRHGSGQRPDVPCNDLWRLRLSSHEQGSENLQKNNKNTYSSSNCVMQVKGPHTSRSGLSNSSLSSENLSKSDDVSTVSNSYANQNNVRTSDQVRREATCNEGAHIDKGLRNVKPDRPLSDVPGRFLFARTRSSPELTDTYGAVASLGSRMTTQESGRGPNSSANLENSNGKYLDHDMPAGYGVRIDNASDGHIVSHHVFDSAADSNNGLNIYDDESGSGVGGEEFASVSGAGGTHMMHQEEQDLLNMMSSPRAQGFTGQARIPVNLAPGHFPLPFSPSILASMGYAQRNMGNFPLIEAPWGSNMQFPQGLVPSPLTPYFPGIGLPSGPEDLIETGHENHSSVEASQAEVDNDFWYEQERPSASGVGVVDGNFEVLQDDKQQSTSSGYNSATSSHVRSSSNSARLQEEFTTKENQGSTKEEHIDSSQYQYGRGNDVYFDDRVANSRFPNAPSSSSFRSKTSSESSWEGSSAKSSKSTREKRGKKNTPSAPSASYGKGKNVLETSCNLVDDENWQGTEPADMSERSSGPVVAPMHTPRQQVSGYEAAQTSGLDSMLPPMLIGHGSRQRPNDNSGAVPFAFYPTGPPVPFVTMLPFYNFPNESSDTSTSNFNVEEGADSNDSSQNFDSSEGRSPWDGPGRPPSANMNIFPLMSYGPHLVPVAPLHSVSNRPPNIYPRFGDEIPRYRSGTGTYLPNPKVSVRDRHSNNTRRGSYNYDRSDHHGDREGNWNMNSKVRTTGRGHNRIQTEKSSSRSNRLAASESNSERLWGSHRHDSFVSHQNRNGPVHVNSSQNTSANVAYGMYPLPGMNSGGNGPTVPSVVMFYPYDHNTGTPGHVGFSGNEGSESGGAFEEQRFHGGTPKQCSPDQPSSPRAPRGH